MSQHWYGRWAVATCCLSRHDLRNLLCLQVLHLYHEYPQNAGLFRVVHLHHISTVVSRCSFNMTAKDNAAIPVSVPVFVPLSLHAALPLLDQLKFLTCKFNLWMHQIGHIIKTTDRWSETHWSSCYNSMWCWETLGPGIHTDASEHESPNQTLLQTKYNLSQQLSWHCPPPARQCFLQRCKKYSAIARGTWQRAQGIDLASKFLTSKSSWASVGYTWTNLIHGGPIS